MLKSYWWWEEITNTSCGFIELERRRLWLVAIGVSWCGNGWMRAKFLQALYKCIYMMRLNEKNISYKTYVLVSVLRQVRPSYQRCTTLTGWCPILASCIRLDLTRAPVSTELSMIWNQKQQKKILFLTSFSRFSCSPSSQHLPVWPHQGT